MWSSYCALLVGVASLSHAIPTTVTHVVHEHRIESAQWKKLHALDQDDLLPIRVGLTQTNLDKGYEMLMAVSDPDSPRYGKYHTEKEVIDIFSPSSETLLAVQDWLESESISKDRITHSDNRGWYAFEATVAEAERLLRTKFHLFEHAETGHKNVATDFYHVPAHLVDHIDYVTPGVRLFSPRKSPVRPQLPVKSWSGGSGNLLANCDKAITPPCLRALYNIPFPDVHGTPQPNNSLGIFEYGDVYLQKNLNRFFKKYASFIPQGTHPTPAFIDGATAPGPKDYDGGESDLDFQLAYPIVYPQKITLYQTDDRYYTDNSVYGDGLFNTFLDAIDGSYCTYKAFGEKGDDPKIDPKYPDPHQGGYKGKLMCGVFKPTPVITMSYGVQEADFPAFYQKRQCNEFMKLGLRGVSVLAASGDSGVAGRVEDVNTQCLGPDKNKFSPSYPGNCPYITAVGATKVPKGSTVHDPEVAPFDPNHGNYSSSGGFSNVYAIPSYQASAVSTFLTQHKPSYPSYDGPSGLNSSTGLFNRAGRGFPDVSANGDNSVVFTFGQQGKSGGTSASSPTFASVINRINEKRLAAGKSSLGFLNTALYKNPSMLNDITKGDNPGCNTTGFNAVAGWDPVTGLGTPNYTKMLPYFMNLQ